MLDASFFATIQDVGCPSPLSSEVYEVGHKDKKEACTAFHGLSERRFVVIVSRSKPDPNSLKIFSLIRVRIAGKGMDSDVLGSQVASDRAPLAACCT